MPTKRISQVRSSSGTRSSIRQKPADTLAAQTRARLGAIAERVESVLDEACSTRRAAESSRLEQAAADSARLAKETLARIESVGELLDDACSSRLESDRARLAEAAQLLRERVGAVDDIRRHTAELLGKNGWTR